MSEFTTFPIKRKRADEVASELRAAIDAQTSGPARALSEADLVLISEDPPIHAIYIPPNDNVLITSTELVDPLAFVTEGWEGSDWQAGHRSVFINGTAESLNVAGTIVRPDQTVEIVGNTNGVTARVISGSGDDPTFQSAWSLTTRTLGVEDLNRIRPFSNASGCEVTLPTGLGIGSETIYLHREPTAGALTISHAGVTVANAAAISTVAAGGTCALKRRATNHWILI